MAENSARKQRGKPFVKGRSGNPSGKAKGTKHKATRAAEALLDGEAEALTRKAIEKALEGDGVALRLCLERIVPPRKDRPITFSLPAIVNAGDVAAAMSGILNAVALGEITPSEASEVAALVETMRRTIETSELERRVATLEGAKKSP